MSLEDRAQQMLFLVGANLETYLNLCNRPNWKGNGQLQKMTSYVNAPNPVCIERDRLQPHQATLPTLHDCRRWLVVPIVLPPS